MKTNSKPIQTDGNSDDFELVCARTVAPSIPVPARDWEAHRRAIGTKFPLPITIKAPRAGPGVGGGNFVPIARRCASQSRAGLFQENIGSHNGSSPWISTMNSTHRKILLRERNSACISFITWPRIFVYLRKRRQGRTFGEPDCIQYCIQ